MVSIELLVSLELLSRDLLCRMAFDLNIDGSKNFCIYGIALKIRR